LAIVINDYHPNQILQKHGKINDCEINVAGDICADVSSLPGIKYFFAIGECPNRTIDSSRCTGGDDRDSCKG
jgi:hypothetical protein